jgi:hypothetical protein
MDPENLLVSPQKSAILCYPASWIQLHVISLRPIFNITLPPIQLCLPEGISN